MGAPLGGGGPTRMLRETLPKPGSDFETLTRLEKPWEERPNDKREV